MVYIVYIMWSWGILVWQCFQMVRTLLIPIFIFMFTSPATYYFIAGFWLLTSEIDSILYFYPFIIFFNHGCQDNGFLNLHHHESSICFSLYSVYLDQLQFITSSFLLQIFWNPMMIWSLVHVITWPSYEVPINFYEVWSLLVCVCTCVWCLILPIEI